MEPIKAAVSDMDSSDTSTATGQSAEPSRRETSLELVFPLVERTAAELLAQRAWRLGEPSALASRVAPIIVQQVNDAGTGTIDVKLVERELVNEYGSQLYAACLDEGSAREQLAYKELWAYLSPLVMHLVSETDLRSDIMQDALMRIHSGLKNVHDPRRFLPWASISTRREIWLRRYRAVELLTEEPFDGEVAQSVELAAYESDAAVESSDLEEVITMALTHLSERERQVIVASYFDGLSGDEIAEKMGLSPTSVYKLMHRARTNLRRLLEPVLVQQRSSQTMSPPSAS
jgi:RNA polymerase sigma factor (sigma-70 family)